MDIQDYFERRKGMKLGISRKVWWIVGGVAAALLLISVIGSSDFGSIHDKKTFYKKAVKLAEESSSCRLEGQGRWIQHDVDKEKEKAE